MKNSRKYMLLITSGALFVASHFLPAYLDGPESMSGFRCLRVCVEATFNSDPWDWVKKGYYIGFAVVSLGFILLFTLSLWTRRRSRVRIIFSILSLAYVLSWLVVNMAELVDPGKDPIRYGYFVWLASFAAVVIANLRYTANGHSIAKRA